MQSDIHAWEVAKVVISYSLFKSVVEQTNKNSSVGGEYIFLSYV